MPASAGIPGFAQVPAIECSCPSVSSAKNSKIWKKRPTQIALMINIMGGSYLRELLRQLTLQYGEKQGYINHLSQLEFRYPKIIEHSFNIISQENLTKLISVLCTDTSRFCLYLKEFITVNVETEWIVM